ncbi:MAG TPA: SDR family oxidoreductase [Paracoccaceae bacterium]|nr:SDR family oxidoreductase [Paracoccaceae bacterium]HMO72564.1 SDR family oxidoreductase [Paracoccaceae bacterium]
MRDLPTFPDLAGASVFVTGGGSGIGAALTEGFLRQGARVAFCQRRDPVAFCDTMEAATGHRPLGLPCDITDTGALRAVLAQAAAAHGPVTVLVNNAADDLRMETLAITPEQWDASQAVNLRAYFFAAQAVIPGMVAAGGGAIVNFSSISYMMADAGYLPYIAANAAITGMTRSIAREFGPQGVRANALAPGWVLTEKQKALWATPQALAAFLPRQCLPESLAPADVVGGCLFLSSRASRMMTGQCLVIDGGVVVTG